VAGFGLGQLHQVDRFGLVLTGHGPTRHSRGR
jgi:hypothetical protein